MSNIPDVEDRTLSNQRQTESNTVSNEENLPQDVIERIVTRRNTITKVMLDTLSSEPLKVTCKTIDDVREEVTAVMQAVALVSAQIIRIQKDQTGNTSEALYQYHCDSVKANLDEIEVEDGEDYRARPEEIKSELL
jgi:thiamine kinase-like enzyme